MIGKEFSSEIKEFFDEKTGNIVKQLTSDGSNNFHFYFTDNSFCKGDQEIYFLSDRSSERPEVYNLFKMNLSNGKMLQLTDESKGITPSFHTKTPDGDIVVYVTGNSLKKIEISTLKTTVLYEEKPGIQLGHPHISADKRYVGMARNEVVPIERGANYKGFKETMYGIKKGWITLISMDGKEVFDVFEDTHWLGHFQFSPINSSLAIFCHEGPWNLVHQRIWLLDLRSRSPKPLYRQGEDDCIGHEFWTSDGKIFFDNRRKGHDGTITIHKTQATIQNAPLSGQIPFVGLADDKGNLIKQIDLPFYCNHYHSNHNNTLLIGDEVDDLVLIDLSGEKATMKTLCSHNTSWNTQKTHCHPTFSWNNELILFTSDREGACNLYLIELPK
ncbi:oligogalacturonate lyase family protein [Metabacillus litoralis]|uniref:oligogalacturonate lyase family protein n=1 Tax=Metabacillus litoralis TaxID=152268 RepID=UPI00203C37D1|nr:oligogalacturonate lyase family protein [Metabacillus litoralis]MCM3160701.1 oligogalacturonate lyase family protein [Metabacillus litoralis]